MALVETEEAPRLIRALAGSHCHARSIKKNCLVATVAGGACPL